MNTEVKAHGITLDVDVDTSGLERAVVLMERLATAAQAARDAIVTINGSAVVADDVVACELQADETPRLILAELQGLRRELADQHECDLNSRVSLFARS